MAKNRNGPDSLIHPIFMDTSNFKIRILPTSGKEEANLQLRVIRVY